MRILQLHNTYLEPGGEDGVVARERELLEKRGHEVSFLEFRNPEDAKDQITGLLKASWNRDSAQRVKRAMSGQGFDLVHVHNTWYQASPSAVAEARRHAPVVATLHNYRRVCLNAYLFRDNETCNDCVGKIPWRGVTRGCYRESKAASAAIGLSTMVNRVSKTLDRSIDRYLVLSDFAADLAVSAGVPAQNVVRHDNFVPDPGERITSTPESSTVLAIGRLSPEKGFVELVNHWKDSAPPGLTLRIVGDGPLRAELESAAGDDVEVLGRLPGDQVAEQMRTCRALLFPSRWYEGQPLVILEALAAGLPVISSDHPPLREVLESAGQRLVTNEAWAEAFPLLKDDSWVERASESARSAYLERFSPSVAGDRLESIYETVLSEVG